MKIIENKELTFETGDKTTVANLIHEAVNGAGNGLNIDEIAERIGIINKCKECDGILELEDAQYNLVMNCVSQTKWRIVDNALVEFRNILKS